VVVGEDLVILVVRHDGSLQDGDGMDQRIGFVADSHGTVAEMRLSPEVSRAYDIMTADQVPAETAASMAVAAGRGGKDPVAFAEHFVNLRKMLREGGNEHGQPDHRGS
jgi:hypothetical protein